MDDLDKLSTAGNVGLLRSMSARTMDSIPGIDSPHNSEISGSRNMLSPVPGNKSFYFRCFYVYFYGILYEEILHSTFYHHLK